MNSQNMYQIFQNSKGDVLLHIDYKDSVPTTPRLIYDGGNTILLYRNASSCICFRDLDVAAREALQMVDEVIVIEHGNEEKGRQYTAQILMVESVTALIGQ